MSSWQFKQEIEKQMRAIPQVVQTGLEASVKFNLTPVIIEFAHFRELKMNSQMNHVTCMIHLKENESI